MGLFGTKLAQSMNHYLFIFYHLDKSDFLFIFFYFQLLNCLVTGMEYHLLSYLSE